MLLRSCGDLHPSAPLTNYCLVSKIETHAIVSDSKIGLGAKVLGIWPSVYHPTTRGWNGCL